jgi:signal transduction histidine kinase
MSMRPFGLLIWPAAAALGIAAEWVAYGLSDPLRWIPDLLVGWGFIGCGLIAAAQQPKSHSGALMAATGFTWFLGNFGGAEAGLLGWVAANGIYLHRGPLVHLILAYPSGRLSSKLARAAAGIGYAAALVPPLWDSGVAAYLLSLLVIGVSARPYAHAIGPQRRARLLGLFAAAAFGVVLAGGAAARLVFPPAEVSYPALFTYQMTLAAIAGGLLVGLLWASGERAEITDLVVELGAARSGTLRAALSSALGDPSLEIGYWFADAHAFVDSEGGVLSLPHPDSKRSVTLMERDNAPIAVVVHDPAVLDDPGLLKAVASASRLAASNARLQAEVHTRVVELAASRRRLLEARDEERRRLELRLHDGAEHRLAELRETLRRAQHSASAAPTKERLVRADEQLVGTLEELRRLAQGLHPRLLSEQGLEGALATLAEGLPVPVELRVTIDRLSPPLAIAIYFVCAEALANVAKHASASKVTLTVTTAKAAVAVVVEDDGVAGADPARGSGLRGMADRIATLGGTFSVHSVPGRGTRLTAEMPLGGEMTEVGR